MFESSLIDLGDKAKRVQTRRWLSLPVAVGIHLVLAASVAFAAYWNIAAVAEPSVNVVFFDKKAQELPPAGPPSPPPGPQPALAPEPVPVPIVEPEQPVQPDDIPDEVPVADPTPAPVVTFAGPVDGPSSDSPGGGSGPGVPGSVGPGGGGCIGPECGDGPPSPVPVVTAATSDAPLPVGGAVTKPETLFRVQPAYTEGARRIRLSGAVIVQAIIDEQGRVTDVRLVKGLPMGLDRAAMDAVRQWRFKPATLHGRPVKVFFNLTVRFEVQ